MTRELAEVRRYWPRAKYDPSCLYQYSAAGGLIGLMILGGEAEIARVVGQKWIRCRGATISEAMRAAGFGRRQLGEYASRLKSARTVLYRRGTYVVISTIDWPPMCVDRQRPRKGARLGRRKREVQP